MLMSRSLAQVAQAAQVGRVAQVAEMAQGFEGGGYYRLLYIARFPRREVADSALPESPCTVTIQLGGKPVGFHGPLRGL